VIFPLRSPALRSNGFFAHLWVMTEDEYRTVEIRILHLLDGARQASGLVVIIDVFRAFSTACYVFANGADKLIPVGDIEIAYELKNRHPDFILMGERQEKIQPGFDFGNSPTQIETVDFTRKTVVQTTSAGTQGIAGAVQAAEIITGSFVNAQAIVAYIRERNPQRVSLVAMGTGGAALSDEDLLCAVYLKNALECQPNDFREIVEHLKSYQSALKFFDPAKEWAPERDFELCMSLDRFNFVLRAEPCEKDLKCLKRVGPQIDGSLFAVAYKGKGD
jgi:2-phosphosulfolactate phosphatase